MLYGQREDPPPTHTHILKEIISQSDQHLVSLSSKKYDKKRMFLKTK